MNIKDKLLNEFTSYTDSQKSLAKVLLTKKTLVCKYNVQEIAALANVSPSMVINFAKKLELDGWDELKYLMKYSFEEELSNDHFLYKITETISDTQKKIEEKKIDYTKIIKLLHSSSSVHIFSRSSSSSISFEFYYKLRKIRNNIFFHSKTMDQINAIQYIKDDCLIIFISNSSNNNDLENLLLLNNTHTNSFLITTNPHGNLCKYFSHVLVGTNIEKSSNFYKDIPIFSKYSLSYMLDSIFYDYYNLYREESENYLIGIKTLLDE